MKNFTRFTLILILLSSGKGYSQFTQLWDKSFQHSTKPNFSNESRKMLQDAAGNIFVLADVTSDGTTPGVTYHYATLLKYSSTGTLLAQSDQSITNHVVSGFDNFSAFGLGIDGSGNVYIGYALYNTANNFNVKIAKFNNSLVRIWTNNFGGTGVETGVDMQVHSSGTVYALIKAVSGANTYYKAIKSINADGNALLVYAFTVNTDVLKSIAVDNNQNIYVAGSRLIGGYRNVLLSSVSGTTNSLRYTSTYNGGLAGDDYANMVTIGVDGNVYVIGTSNQGGGHGSDQVVLKHSTNAGSGWTWTSLLQNSSTDEGLFVTVPENSYLYTGMTSNKKVRVMRLNTSDGKISVSGAAANYEPLPGSYTSITSITLKDMKVSTGKNIYVTGSVLAVNSSGQSFTSTYLTRYDFNATNGTIHIGFSRPVQGDFISNYMGTSIALNYSTTSVVWMRDYWSTSTSHATEQIQLLGLDVPSTLRDAPADNVSTVTENTLSFYPNPATGTIYFNTDQTISSIEICDMTGKIATAIVNPLVNKIDISMLRPGLYIAKVITLSGTDVKRIVVK